MLLVDADPQGDLTKSLGWRDPDALEVTLASHLADCPSASGIKDTNREDVVATRSSIIGRGYEPCGRCNP